MHACRSIAERALRRVVANKDAEAVRLQSEIARLRHAQAATDAAGRAAAPLPALDAAGRQVLLDAAVAASEKPIAAVLQLQRYAENDYKLSTQHQQHQQHQSCCECICCSNP